MEELYRLKKGSLFNEKFQKDIRFCLVYNDEGMLKLDLYYDSDKEYSRSEVHDIMSEPFNLHAITIKDETVQIEGLQVTLFSNGDGFLKLTCHSRFVISEKEYDHSEVLALQKNINREQILYSLELEGMKIKFTDLTHKAEILDSGDIGDMIDFVRDHTDTALAYKRDEENFSQMYKATITEVDSLRKEKNLKLRFTEETLEYSEYLKFKDDLICFLSLINGAEVAIRREVYGSEFAPAHTSIHSFKNVDNQKYSSYIPVNSPFHSGEEIIPFLFLFCFDNYRKYNKILDLNYTVRFLCNATQASSIEQSFITLIVAFERLASFASQIIEKKLLLETGEFKKLKDRLINEIDKLESEAIEFLNSEEKAERSRAYNKFKNKICSLNNTDKIAQNKFEQLIEYGNINLTPEIKNIIIKVRNESIHEGNIGEWPDSLKNYFVLVELLRDIILNLINYKKVRDSRVYK